jgi:hypothetical protein
MSSPERTGIVTMASLTFSYTVALGEAFVVTLTGPSGGPFATRGYRDSAGHLEPYRVRTGVSLCEPVGGSSKRTGLRPAMLVRDGAGLRVVVSEAEWAARDALIYDAAYAVLPSSARFRLDAPRPSSPALLALLEAYDAAGHRLAAALLLALVRTGHEDVGELEVAVAAVLSLPQ